MMTLEPVTLAAAFFIPRDERTPLGVEDRLLQAGVVDRRWAGVPCTPEIEATASFDLLTIRFRRSDFLALLSEDDRPTPLEADGALPLAIACRDACIALGPDAAIVATHDDQASPDFIRSLDWRVLSRDANGLADLRLGLLYLSGELAKNWTPNPVRDDRDSLEVSHGKLVFAGRGWARWF